MSKAHWGNRAGQVEREWARWNDELYRAEYGLVISSGKNITSELLEFCYTQNSSHSFRLATLPS